MLEYAKSLEISDCSHDAVVGQCFYCLPASEDGLHHGYFSVSTQNYYDNIIIVMLSTKTEGESKAREWGHMSLNVNCIVYIMFVYTFVCLFVSIKTSTFFLDFVVALKRAVGLAISLPISSGQRELFDTLH